MYIKICIFHFVQSDELFNNTCMLVKLCHKRMPKHTHNDKYMNDASDDLMSSAFLAIVLTLATILDARLDDGAKQLKLYVNNLLFTNVFAMAHSSSHT